MVKVQKACHSDANVRHFDGKYVYVLFVFIDIPASLVVFFDFLLGVIITSDFTGALKCGKIATNAGGS